jgi:hypothetical protein
MKNILFEGFYNTVEMGLAARADWKIGKISLAADMSQDKIPDVHVRLRLDSVQIDKFYENKDWVNPHLTMALNAHIKGLDIDNMEGSIDMDSIDFHDDNFIFRPGKFTMEAGKKPDGSKFVTLASSLLTANLTGRYSFTSLPDEFAGLMNRYLPAVFRETKEVHEEQNDFTFNITANNTEELGRIFALPVDILRPATVSGQVNTITGFVSVKGDIPSVRYGDWDIKDTEIGIANRDSSFNVTAASAVLMDKGSYKLSLNIDGERDMMHPLLSVKGDSTDININGTVGASVQFGRNAQNELISSLKVTPSDIMVDKLALNLLPAEITNTGTRTEIHNLGLGVNKKKYLDIEGVVSEQKTDTLRVNFDHAEIGDLLESFDVKNIRGNVHGNVLLTNLLDRPELYTKEFQVSDIVVFGDTLGTVNIVSRWSDEYGGIQMQAAMVKAGLTLAEIDGTVYTRQDSLDLQLRTEKMPLHWIEPFASEFLNKLDGTLSSGLTIEGSTKAPQMKGFLGFNNMQIGIDYTNVTYTISDTIKISPGRIGFDNLTVKDGQGNTANVSATLTHKNFNDMKYSLTMQMNKLMVLNTESRTDSLFYGRVFASGNVKIEGDNNGAKMNMQLRNDKNSNLNILLPQHSEATDYKSVVYINVPEEKLKDTPKNTATVGQSLPITLNVKLDVTPDLAIGVVIDSSTGDAMQARGNGTVNFFYNMMNDNMTTYGDYTITDGTVKLNLQNIKKLNFAIQNGSKLDFIGDPRKTKFNITAYKRVRAALETLDASFAMDNSSSSKVDVDCILGISGNMDNMNLTYNISLPGSNDDTQQKVNSYISTDEQKIKQFASLVAMGTFYPSSGSSGANFGNGLWTSVAGTAISSIMTSLVGNMLGDKWQIGASVESNDGTLSDMDMQVNVSRKFMDDRLTLKTNLGYRTDQSNVDNSFIGNFDMEYRLNPMWTLTVYSHTNDKYYRQAPTTQGIGVVYSKEAATLKRLFRSFRPRRRRTQEQIQGQEQNPVQQQTVEKQPAINDGKKE